MNFKISWLFLFVMKIRKSNLEDIPNIISIIKDAQLFLASLGIDQWQNGYPNIEQIKHDIHNQESYVVVADNTQILGTTMFTLRAEPTYKTIFDGEWIIDEKLPYGVIHRMAVSNAARGLGVAKMMFDYFHKQLENQNIQSLKIDTHQDNKSMQGLIKSLNYQYCGIIYTSYGDKRLAFEKVLY